MTAIEAQMEHERLTRYLLGELPGDEEDEIEAALLADQTAWDSVRLAEDELIDAYVLGRFDRDRSARIAARVAASPRLQERVTFSRNLHATARAQPAAAQVPWLRRVGAWLAAHRGGLVLAGVGVAALLVAISWPRGGEPAQVAVVASLVLEPPTRAAPVPAVTIAGVGVVEVTALLDPEELFPSYRLRIVGARGTVWSSDGVIGTGSSVRAAVPTSALAPGAYGLELTGLRPDGEAVSLGSRDFRVSGATR